MASQLDKRTPTEYLILEVLAARWRLGADLWPFPSEMGPTLRKLEKQDLIWFKGGVVEQTYLVALTEIGLSEMSLHKPFMLNGKQSGCVVEMKTSSKTS